MTVLRRVKLNDHLDGELCESSLYVLWCLDPSATNFGSAATELDYAASTVEQRWNQLVPEIASDRATQMRVRSSLRAIAAGLREGGLILMASFPTSTTRADLTAIMESQFAAFVTFRYGDLRAG